MQKSHFGILPETRGKTLEALCDAVHEVRLVFRGSHKRYGCRHLKAVILTDVTRNPHCSGYPESLSGVPAAIFGVWVLELTSWLFTDLAKQGCLTIIEH